MPKRLSVTGPRLALWLCLMLFPITGFAVIETYKGVLTPDPYDESIPIVLELETIYGNLSGKVKMSPPMTGEGRVMAGSKRAGTCRLVVDMGTGTLRMEGKCDSTSFEGNYALTTGQKRLVGSFKLNRPQQEMGLSASERRRLSETASNACLQENTACLVSCPRGNYNAEFLCVASCRNKRDACNTKAKRLLETPAAGLN